MGKLNSCCGLVLILGIQFAISEPKSIYVLSYNNGTHSTTPTTRTPLPHRQQQHLQSKYVPSKYTVEDLLNTVYLSRISNDIDMDPCKSGTKRGLVIIVVPSFLLIYPSINRSLVSQQAEKSDTFSEPLDIAFFVPKNIQYSISVHNNTISAQLSNTTSTQQLRRWRLKRRNLQIDNGCHVHVCVLLTMRLKKGVLWQLIIQRPYYQSSNNDVVGPEQLPARKPQKPFHPRRQCCLVVPLFQRN